MLNVFFSLILILTFKKNIFQTPFPSPRSPEALHFRPAISHGSALARTRCFPTAKSIKKKNFPIKNFSVRFFFINFFFFNFHLYLDVLDVHSFVDADRRVQLVEMTVDPVRETPAPQFISARCWCLH